MVKGKKGLGKGIESLIEDYGVPQEIEKAEQPDIYLKISQVEPNRKQPRKNFDENAMEELTESVKQYGIIQPLIVRKKENYYEIIAGERRWRAAKMAGLKEVPVVIRNYTDEEIMEISLIENIQRENLNPMEEAAAYKRLLTEFHLKQEEIAERVSKSRTAVTNSMRLLKLDERVQQMVVEEMLSTGHARALLGVEDPELQFQAANKVYNEKMSVREVEKLVKKIGREKPVKKEKDTQQDAVYRDLEEKMKVSLGTKVTINRKDDNKGKIEIEYYSMEELERLMEIFMR